jgi:hypothetical protein
MTSTSHEEDDAEGADGALPSENTEAKKEPKTVPLGELIEQRQKSRELSEKVAKLEEALAKLSKQPEKAATPNAAGQESDIVQTVKELQRNQQIAATQESLGVNRKQAQIIADLLSKHADLAPEEALTIAAMRNPDDFKDRGAPNPAKAEFGSLVPKPGSQPPQQQVSDWKQRLDYVRQVASVDKRRHHEYANNLAGKFLAKALGWEHHDLPLPKQ